MDSPTDRLGLHLQLQVLAESRGRMLRSCTQEVRSKNNYIQHAFSMYRGSDMYVAKRETYLGKTHIKKMSNAVLCPMCLKPEQNSFIIMFYDQSMASLLCSFQAQPHRLFALSTYPGIPRKCSRLTVQGRFANRHHADREPKQCCESPPLALDLPFQPV